MASIVAVADVPTASVQVTVEGEVLEDTFTRVVANGWGNADSGQAWTSTGGAVGDYSVTGARGQHAVTTTAVTRVSSVPMTTGNFVADVTAYPVAVALTSATEQWLQIRADASGANGYRARLRYNTGGTVDLFLERVVASVGTTLGSAATVATYTAPAGIRVKFSALGSQLRVKAWNAASAEPGAYQITVTDTTFTTGTLDLASARAAGNTNGTINMQFDDLFVCTPYDTLLRVYPDGTTAPVRGADPFLFSACAAVFYDTEAPLNTAVFYRATATGITDVITSNTVIIESGEDGWLKDPLRPYNDIQLDNCAVHSPQCISTDANIFFQRLEPEVYDSASGVFEIVDNARPNVVAMTRKDQHSVLGIVSRKLSDITRIRTLLSPGSPLLLQLPTRYGWGIETWGSDYTQVYDNSARRLGPDMGKPYRDWSLPFTMARSPADISSGGTGGSSIGVPGKLYRDSTATGRTYAQSTALGRTYLVRSQHPTF